MNNNSNNNNSNDVNMLYELEGRPSFKVAFPLGLQHILAMFAGNLAPIFIIAGVVGLEAKDMVIMIQCAMFASGLTTIVQLYPIKLGSKYRIGANLPIVMGTSFAFVGVSISVALAAKAGGATPIEAMAIVITASMIGAISEVLLGLFYPYLKKLFSPVVVGSVLVTIGIGLLDVGRGYLAGGAGALRLGNIVDPASPFKALKFPSGDLMTSIDQATGVTGAYQVDFSNTPFAYGSPKNLFLGFLVFFIVILLQKFTKGVLKAASMLIAMTIGYLVAIPMGGVNFASVSNAGIFSVPIPGHFGFKFVPTAAISFVLLYIVSGMETIGNSSGITVAVFDRKATKEETSGALLADAFGSMFAGLFNSLPNTAYGQNAGLIAMTKIINKWCILLGALTLVLASFFPKLGAIFSSIPSSVLGGAVVSVFAMILLNGMKLIAKAGFTERNVLIIGVTFGLGYGLGGHSDAVAGLPSIVQNVLFYNPTASVCIIAILAHLVLGDHSVESEF